MDTNEILLKDEVYQVVGSAIEVLNGLGHGLHEKPYENALVVEFGIRRIPFRQQPRFDVLYKQVKVSEYVPDLIAFGKVVVDTKVIDRITDHERGQLLNYLRITGLPVGVILNFKRSQLEWERLVLTRPIRSSTARREPRMDANRSISLREQRLKAVVQADPQPSVFPCLYSC